MSDELKKSTPPASGLRALAARYPSITIAALVFSGIGALMALQTCT
jgi:hypothetical protein